MDEFTVLALATLRPGVIFAAYKGCGALVAPMDAEAPLQTGRVITTHKVSLVPWLESNINVLAHPIYIQVTFLHLDLECEIFIVASNMPPRYQS